MLKIKRVAVVGAGQMGGGIAQTAAAVARLPVILYDPLSGQLEKSTQQIARLLAKDQARGKLTEGESQESVLARIRTTSNLSDLREADLVIEAITEDFAKKAALFRELGAIIRGARESPGATQPIPIMASNTSSISITKLASAWVDPSRCVGMHFMNPVPVMRLVELISGRQTSPETVEQARLLAEAMGKTTTVSADIPGFIANRILMPYINEAIFVLYEGIATKEDIDTTMVLGTNVPMGPLKLADFVGLDTCLAIMRVLHEELGDSKYRPCPLLVQHVNAGWLGKKNGRGFYEWPGPL